MWASRTLGLLIGPIVVVPSESAATWAPCPGVGLGVAAGWSADLVRVWVQILRLDLGKHFLEEAA